MVSIMQGCVMKGAAILAGVLLFIVLGFILVGALQHNDAPVDYYAIQRQQNQLKVEATEADIEAQRLQDGYQRERAFWNNVFTVGVLLLPALLLAIPLGLLIAAGDQYVQRRKPLIWPRVGDLALPTRRRVIEVDQ